jgi:hypothetical protein
VLLSGRSSELLWRSKHRRTSDSYAAIWHRRPTEQNGDSRAAMQNGGAPIPISQGIRHRSDVWQSASNGLHSIFLKQRTQRRVVRSCLNERGEFKDCKVNQLTIEVTPTILNIWVFHAIQNARDTGRDVSEPYLRSRHTNTSCRQRAASNLQECYRPTVLQSGERSTEVAVLDNKCPCGGIFLSFFWKAGTQY